MRLNFIFATVGIVLLPLLGVGCPSWLGGPVDPNSLTREEKNQNAQRLSFIEGDTFEIRQTLFGFGNTLNELRDSDEGIRKVTIKDFQPNRTASLSWELPIERETEESKMDRQEFEEAMKNLRSTTSVTDIAPPTIRFETVASTGTLQWIDLAGAHVATVPGSWQPGDTTLEKEGGIWLSYDAHQELSRTGKTQLRIKSLDTPNTLLDNIRDLKIAWDNLRKAERTEAIKKDTNLITKDGEVIDWPLNVNGKQTYVSAIKARHWYGDLIILDNAQNPLILKFTLNPLRPELLTSLDKENYLEKIFGYEVTEIHLQNW